MSNEEYMIFYGEKDIDYTKSNNYAFLNWDFDNSRGGKNNVYQSVEDNFVIFSMERQYHQLLLMALLLIQIYKITVDVLEFGILVLLQQDVLAHLQY